MSKSDVTINIYGNSGSSNQDEIVKLSPWQSTSRDVLTKEEVAQELEKGNLVNVNDDNGGVVHARLLCTPQGSGKYYSDTRGADGRLEIGKEVASPYYIGTGKPD